MPMYSVSIKSLLTKSGQLDRRKSIKASIDNINTKDIENAVYKRVIKAIYSDPIEGDDGETVEIKKHKSWLTSTVGTTMLVTNIVSSGFSLSKSEASTDTAAIAKSGYTATKGLTINALGLIPVFGPVITKLAGLIDGLVGDAITNQMQLSYDNSRLSYGMTRYDTGRFSTYVYDYDKNIWRAQDAERVKQNILHQTT